MRGPSGGAAALVVAAILVVAWGLRGIAILLFLVVNQQRRHVVMVLNLMVGHFASCFMNLFFLLGLMLRSVVDDDGGLGPSNHVVKVGVAPEPMSPWCVPGAPAGFCSRESA